ncbi:MAG TPA: hemolysin III family protein [Pirellulales bacterium]|nr:hemolysin III family protein [Pirellulales bacterium]
MQIVQHREAQHAERDERETVESRLDSARDAVRARLREEDKLNTATHALGFVLSLIGCEWLMSRVVQSGDGWQIAGCAVYAAALVAVYAASSLSHHFQRPRLRRLFRILDQAFIFLLIAGTFTPISLSYLRQGAWWALFAAVWAIALFGFFSKAIFAHRVDAVTTGLHVALGWLPAMALKPMIGLVPGGLFGWMLCGGLCYTAGTFFLQRDERVPYFHAVWHLLVIAGSACHFWGIYTYCAVATA